MNEFKKTLQKRMIIYSLYLIVGIALVIISVITPDNINMIPEFGCSLILIGIVRMIRTLGIMKSDESMEKHRLIETDERNIFISNKAKSLAVNIYIILGASAVIVLNILNHHVAAQIIAYNICAVVFIELICYWVLMRKY